LLQTAFYTYENMVIKSARGSNRLHQFLAMT
jgi:hypothetical protein